MKRTQIASTAAFGLVALLAVAGSARGYGFLYPTQTWDCPPKFIVDETGVPSVDDGDGGVSIVVNAINAASTSIDTWNNAGAARLLSAQKGSTANLVVGDGVPMIKFSDPDSECTDPCLALTFVTAHERVTGSSSWKIYDSDTVTNVTDFNWTTQGEDPLGTGCYLEAYLESTMVHEVGHSLGLAHSNVSGATMFPQTTYCSNAPATIEADDESGIKALYGTAPCTGSLFTPCLTYTQYLTGDDDIDTQPCNTTFTMAGSGTIKGWIQGPFLADFDLFLQKLNPLGIWVQVANGSTTSSEDSITYSGTAGTYRFRVKSFDGSGTYHFWYQRPTLFP